MLGRLIDSALSKSGYALESAKDVTVEKALYSAGLIFLVMLIGERSAKFYRSYAHAPLFTADDLARLSHDLQSVNTLYDRAMIEMFHGSLGQARNTINLALTAFKVAVGRNKALSEVNDNKAKHAKLLEKRAEIFVLQGEYAAAEQDLLEAIRLGRAATSAYNMLAHIYINHLHDPSKADLYLEQSWALDSQQLFARFYRGCASGNAADADAVANEILAVYHRQFLAQQEISNEVNPMLHKTTEWNRLHHTAPAICVPYLVMNWLEMKMSFERDPRMVLSMADSLKMLLTEHVDDIPKMLQVKLKEARIKALMRVATLRKNEAAFNDNELVLRQKNSFQEGAEDARKHYFVYAGQHVDHAVSDLFTDGIQTDFLYEYPQKMGAIIKGWAQQGWLVADNQVGIHLLCEKLQLLKRDQYNEALISEIDKICTHPETIKHFIDTYVKDMGWLPWLRVVVRESADDQRIVIFSLLAIACDKQGVHLKLHLLDEQQTPALHLLDNKVANHLPCLSVAYQAGHSEFQMMHELTTPSRLYRWLALRECWDLLRHDDAFSHPVLEILGARGYATLPQMALARLSDSDVSSLQKEAVIAGLKKYIDQHKGNDKDKEFAQSILADYRSANQRTNGMGLFSSRVMFGVGLAAAAGVAYCLRK